MTRVLLLGGTSEASRMAQALSAAGIDAVFSYAGRTETPVVQPLPTRVGGFGGIAGLAGYLDREAVTHLIDATHPFAAQISRNAVAACALAGTRLLALERPPWTAAGGDRWRCVADIPAAVAALPAEPGRIFLAIGRQNLAPFAARSEHYYLLRIVDRPAVSPLPGADIIVARGPFTPAADLALMQAHRITHLVAKNSGGEGAYAKLNAAGTLGLPVILIERPHLPEREIARDVETAMAWLV
jgi:precorrin-6A/cobalt-precorrin-6A reductase